MSCTLDMHLALGRLRGSPRAPRWRGHQFPKVVGENRCFHAAHGSHDNAYLSLLLLPPCHGRVSSNIGGSGDKWWVPHHAVSIGSVIQASQQETIGGGQHGNHHFSSLLLKAVGHFSMYPQTTTRVSTETERRLHVMGACTNWKEGLKGIVELPSN